MTCEHEWDIRTLRRHRLTLIVVALLLGTLLVISNIAYRKRKQARAIQEDRIAEYNSARSKYPRYVDLGVRINVLKASKSGREVLPGLPWVEVVHDSEHGGVMDTKRGIVVQESAEPLDWYCSEDQYDIILHGDELAMGILAYGSEGAGKTELLPRWHFMRWLENLDAPRIGKDGRERKAPRREGGQTAPTKRRLKMFEDAFFRVFPKSWVKKYRRSEGQITLCDGTRIQLMQTRQQSRAGGSPIQGYNWSWCGSDEFQDSYERSDDIDARGRSARAGIYKQLRTCTAKDTTAWREFKSKLLSTRDIRTNAPLWELRKILGRRSPFVPASHWDTLRSKLSPREYCRRVEPLDDQPPELAVYYGFDRARNLITLPPGIKDVTERVLANYPSYLHPGRRFGLLVCHDPGNIYNTSVVLRMFLVPQRTRELVPTWVVVGEIQSKQTTQRQHAQLLAKYLRDTFYCNHPTIEGPLAMVFPDPHGKGEKQTDYQTVYMALQGEGLDTFNPSEGTRINRRSRVDMVNRLMIGVAAAIGQPRLVVAVANDNLGIYWDTNGNRWEPITRGMTLAPKLVEAFESLVKKPGDDDPEGSQRKDEDDKTHAPAALGYGLWNFEQEAFTLNTIRVALTEPTHRRAA